MKKLKKGLLAEFPQASRNRAAHFRGSRKPARSLRQGFGGSQNLPRNARLIYGNPGTQRGVCGKVSGGRKTFPQLCGSFTGIRGLSGRFRTKSIPIFKHTSHRRVYGSFRLFFHGPAILSADHISAVRRNCYFYSSVIFFCVVT